MNKFATYQSLSITLHLKGRLQHASGCGLMCDDLLEIYSTSRCAFFSFWCGVFLKVVRPKLYNAIVA